MTKFDKLYKELIEARISGKEYVAGTDKGKDTITLQLSGKDSEEITKVVKRVELLGEEIDVRKKELDSIKETLRDKIVNDLFDEIDKTKIKIVESKSVILKLGVDTPSSTKSVVDEDKLRLVLYKLLPTLVKSVDDIDKVVEEGRKKEKDSSSSRRSH